MVSEWTRSLSRRIGNPIESVDAVRIRAAFDYLVDHSKFWPAPAELAERLPPRPQRRAIVAPISDDEAEAAKKRVREIISMIGNKGIGHD